MIRLFIAVLALLFAMVPAGAASFDCAKAASSFEKAVCADETLSHLDDVLATGYATALGGLSPAAADIVKATQHSWLDYAQRVCSPDAKPIAGAYNEDQISCLQSTYRNRLRALEASRMMGEYRFYPQETYAVERDTEATADDFNKVSDKHFQTVKIDGGEEDELAAAFNQMTEDMRVAHTDYFPDGQEKFAAGDSTEDVDISSVVKSVSPYRISLETTEYFYGHGAAHGNYAVLHQHFLISEMRPLAASDIFAKAGWEKTIATLTIAKAKAQLGDSYFSEAEPDMEAIVADPTRWDFATEGLIIQFQPYDVASYAQGAVTVTLPWDEIRDLLAENGEAIGTY